MPRTIHTAAKSTWEMATRRRWQAFFGVLLAIGAFIVGYLLLTHSNQLKIGGTGFLVLLILFALIPNLFDRFASRQEKLIKRADRGAYAEEDVADILSQLGDDFVVIHDVDSPYGNIDHLVISQKGGIILLETKSHHGTVTMTDSEILVNGHSPEKNFIAQTLSNSLWLRDELQDILVDKPWISAYVVFTNAFVKSDKPVKGVRVVNKKYLLKTLQSLQSEAKNNAIIWAKRDQIIALAIGQTNNRPKEPEPKSATRFCPQCGKLLILSASKKEELKGKRFLVCPDYPTCKVAIPVD